MAGFKFLFLSALVVVCCLSLTESSCSDSPCESMDIPTIIKHLWKYAFDLTPEAEEYKNELICLARATRDKTVQNRKRKQGLILSLTLWAVDRYTGFDSPIPPSCVYEKLVSATLCGCPKQIKAAYHDYSYLCSNATAYSIKIGMMAAGCCVDDLPDPCPSTKPQCTFPGSITSLLNRPDSELPASLKPLVIKLSESCNEDDRAIANAAAGSVTKSSVDLFAELLACKELHEVLKLKACPIKISPCDCPEREGELKKRTTILRAKLLQILKAKLMK